MKSRKVDAPGSCAEKLMTLRLVYPRTSGSCGQADVEGNVVAVGGDQG